jgi:molybdopterin/thiamine biosynthesis adenylyltransferase
MESGTSLLTDLDRSIYEWQMWVPGVGETGQAKLKNTSVLISRVGGLGGVVALELAAAGIGRLVLPHGGNLKSSDLNRQLLQTRAHIGKPRADSIRQRLLDLNPDCEVVAVPENLSPANADRWIAEADIVVDAAPMFEERLAMNAAAFRQRKPMVECAMHTLSGHVTTFISGKTGCLACYVPEVPRSWTRQFPVFGAVSGTIACIGATEVIKWVTGIGTLLTGQMLHVNLEEMQFRKVRLPRREDCQVCSGSPKSETRG